jgi:hypothetical protein
MPDNDNIDIPDSDASTGDIISDSPVAILKRAPDPNSEEKQAPHKPVAPYSPRSASTTQLKKVAGEIGAALQVLKDTSAQSAKDIAAVAPEDDLFAAAFQAQAEAKDAVAEGDIPTAEDVEPGEPSAAAMAETGSADEKPAAKLKLIAPPKAPAKEAPPKPKVQPYKMPVEQQAVETAKIVATAVVNKFKFSASKSMAVSDEGAIESEEAVAVAAAPLQDSAVIKKVKLSTTKAPAITDADLAEGSDSPPAEVAKKVKLSTTKAPAITDADLSEKPEKPQPEAAVAKVKLGTAKATAEEDADVTAEAEKPQADVAVAKVKPGTAKATAEKDADVTADAEKPQADVAVAKVKLGAVKAEKDADVTADAEKKESSPAAKSDESKTSEKKKALKPVKTVAPDLKLTAEPAAPVAPSMAPRPSLEPSTIMPALETGSGGGGKKRPSVKWVATFVIAATTCVMVIYTVVGGSGEFSDVQAVVPTPVVADIAPDALHQFVVPETLPQSELDIPEGN